MGRLGTATAAIGSVVASLTTTPRRVLATLAGNSLFFRALPDALARVDDLLVDSVAVPFVLAALSARGRDIQIVGGLFGWLMLAYLVYEFLPRLLPDADPAAAVLGRRRVRLLLTVLVCLLAIPLADQAPGIGSISILPSGITSLLDQRLGVVGLIAGWLVASPAVLGSVLYARWWRTASADDRIAFFRQLTPGTPTPTEREKTRDSLAREDWVRSVSSAVLLTGCVFALALICLLFALSAGFAGILFPLPEVVVLLGVTGSALTTRLPGTGLFTNIRGRVVAVETRLYTVIQYVSTSRKGLTLSLVFVTGALLSILLTLVSFAAVAVFVVILVVRPDVFLGSRVGLVTRWNVLGLLVCFAVPGLYSLWFWLRETARIPHFLQYWEETHPGSASVVETDLPDLVARPPGAVLLPTAFVALVPLFFRIEPDTVALVPDILFAVAWPAAFVATLWSVRWTARATPQHPRTERYVLPLVYLLHLVWVWVLFKALGQTFVTSQIVVALAILGLAVYYRPELSIRLESRLSRTRYLVLIEAVVSGGIFVAVGLGLRASGSAGVIPVAAGVLLVGGGLLAFALLWLADRAD